MANLDIHFGQAQGKNNLSPPQQQQQPDTLINNQFFVLQTDFRPTSSIPPE
jgi:hypothetical protein